MVEVVVTAQNSSDQLRLDVQQQPVEFNYAIQEMRDISNVRAPFSFTFTCPMTDKNNKFSVLTMTLILIVHLLIHK